MHLSTRLLLLACLVVIGTQARGQVPFPTKVSPQFITQQELDSVLLDGVIFAASDNQVPDLVVKQRYPNFAQAIYLAAKKLLKDRFLRVEARNKPALARPNDPQLRAAIREDYFSEAKQMVDRVMRESPALRQMLNFDPSDRIMLFDSKISLLANATLQVKEQITIYNGDGRYNSHFLSNGYSTPQASTNNEINRGIIRAFPTRYNTPEGLIWEAPFKVISVTRNGKSEPFHTQTFDNGVLLYLGSEDVMLESGVHQYEISYETGWQVNYFADFDQLAWNVTGNGWTFRIDSANWEIALPEGVALDSMRCFSGFVGSTEHNCQFSIGEKAHVAFFSTNGPLEPYQGLTASVNFPKDAVKEPSKQAYYLKLIRNNIFLAIGILILVALVIFDAVLWFLVGRDPSQGTIIPQFAPPADLSPAAMGYVYFQKWNDRLATATLVDAAIHKVLKINVKRDKGILKATSYHLAKTEGSSTQTTYSNHFSSTRTLIGTTLKKGEYLPRVQVFRDDLKKDLEETYRIDQKKMQRPSGLFSLNTHVVVLGSFLLGASAASFFVYLIFQPSESTMIKAALLWVVGLVIHRLFAGIMKAYTEYGRAVADDIKGFRMFLVTADQRRLDAMNPPELTIELYEKYMPFALALGVENAWGKKFESVFNAQQGRSSQSYSSQWHNMNYDNFGSDMSRSFVSSMSSSFTGAISSSSTPPSSSDSSGSSSFGSGGGGGGGGGSGW